MNFWDNLDVQFKSGAGEMDHYEDNTQHTSTQDAQQQAQVGEQERGQVDAEAQERAQTVAAKQDKDAKTYWIVVTGINLYLYYLGLNQVVFCILSGLLADHLHLFKWRYIFLSLFFQFIVLTFWNVF
ncbi:hypothetical protein FC83_GL002611 [Agrilactobacillus composti DSM 18527 = JCM 14202]|uniref:Uncharacterized protein n=2 Tax=Agrilactobacillus TaxID=2767875 RepID=X0PHT7_9LACO|nr:hypothetical protein FC83_GL002611 [Agrilactobacillus composti DSM 18527 = JCM 14202]GAF41583.1 hypothetical protein JCM14202_3533 [Agrilactobacillus composti DSM 18527 = JCM 14202]